MEDLELGVCLQIDKGGRLQHLQMPRMDLPSVTVTIGEHMSALAAIIGYLSSHQRTPEEVWIYRTALKGFGVNTFEEYLQLIGA